MDRLCEECEELEAFDGPRPDDPDFAYDDDEASDDDAPWYDVDGPAYDMPIGC